MPNFCTETKNYLTFRIGNLEFSVRRVIREGGVDILPDLKSGVSVEKKDENNS